jgi:antitoxin VapB
LSSAYRAPMDSDHESPSWTLLVMNPTSEVTAPNFKGLESLRQLFCPPKRIRRRDTNPYYVYTMRIYIIERCCMGTARVFRSGNSQAVRLPKQFRLKSKEVEIFRRGDEIVLREKDGTMVRAFDLLAGLPDDLDVSGREDDQPQKRKGL